MDEAGSLDDWAQAQTKLLLAAQSPHGGYIDRRHDGS